MLKQNECNGVTMKGRKSASSQVRVNINLMQLKKSDEVILWKKHRKKGGRSCMKKYNTEMKDEKRAEDIKQELHIDSCSCQMYSKIFKRKDRLDCHHKLKHAKNGFQCVGCSEEFMKEIRQEHGLTCERNNVQLECCFCDLACDTPKDLRTHEKKCKPIRKTKTCRNICVCAECKKGFDSIPLLKAHIQRDHTKNETHTNEETEDEINVDACLTDVSNFTNELQYERESQLGRKPPSIQIPQVASKEYLEKDKPFLCLQCGSRYKYEKSKLKHELKYHRLVGEMSQKNGEVKSNQQTKTSEASQVLNKDEYKFEMECKGEKPESEVINDNNNTINVKEVNILLPVADASAHDVPEKTFSTRSHSVRNVITKKKCIGCDKVFDGPKERDEHELECGLNRFNTKFNCMFCDRPFRKPKSLRRHENKHRPARKTKKYKNRCVCIECNKTFDAIYSLRVHMKKLHRKGHKEPVDGKPFACSICDSRFKYENSKCKHEMRHHCAEAVGYSSDGSIFTKLNMDMVSNSDADPLVYTLENSGPDHIKEDCGDDNSGNPTENKMINSVHNVKKVNVTVDTLLTGDVKMEDKVPQRKRKGKIPVDKKPKKQKTGPFVCNNCEAKFNSPQGLWLHSYHQNMRTKRLSCIGCGKTFRCEKDTEEHELRCDVNRNEYDFNCMFCDEPFGSPKLLRNHEVKHRPRRRTKNYKCVCIDCRRPFDSIHSLKKHVRECHKNRVKTGEVNAQSDERNLLMEEMKSCYVLLKDITLSAEGSCKSKRIYAADSIECELGTEQYGCAIKVKEEMDSNKAVCDISGGKADDIKPDFPDDLIEAPAYLVKAELADPGGVMQPEGTESFHCGKCNSKFDSYGKFRYHSYSHRRRTKRLFCIGCGEGFEQSNDRDRHELECSVNLTRAHFRCIFCELAFDTPQTLRNHEKKHRPPKRYKRYKHMCLCAECDRAFDAVFTLKIHIRHVHRGNKEKVTIKEEVEGGCSESDLTLEEYNCDGDLNVEKPPR